MKYFSLLIVAGVLLFSACKSGNNSPKTAGELMDLAAPNMNAGAGKFTIETPKDWRRVDTAINGIKTTLLLSPDVTHGFRPNINIVTENMKNDSLQAYFDKTVATMQQYLEKFRQLDKGDKVINGIPSKWLLYNAVQGGNAVVAMLYIVPKGGIAYGITGIAKAEQGNAPLAVFEHAVSTFRVAE